MNQAFLQRQLAQFFRHREENADQALVDKLWESELLVKSKDNQIKEMNKSIQRLEQAVKLQQKSGKTVVDHYILQPSLVLMQLQSKLDKSKRRENLAEKQVKQMQKVVTDKDFEISNLTVKLESMAKLTQVNEN